MTLSYLASMTVMEQSLTEHCSALIPDEFDSASFLPVKNAGCFGVGSGILSLPSIEITSDIVGLSVAPSCTHNSPTCITRKNCSVS